MSWQTYVDDHLMVPLPNGGQLSHAAIVGQDGGVWAQDASFPTITVEETLALVKGCNDTSTLTRYLLLVSWCQALLLHSSFVLLYVACFLYTKPNPNLWGKTADT